MSIIIETDLGHDPDDFFALCYLYSAGVDIKAITLADGDPDQVAIAKFFCKEVGINIPIGVATLNRIKPSSGGMHYELLNKHGFPKEYQHDGTGLDILNSMKNEDFDIFIIGPMKSCGRFLQNNPDKYIRKIVIQGGFLSNELNPTNFLKLNKFNGKKTCATFNLGGSKEQSKMVLAHKNVGERRSIGKNVCHAIIYDKEIRERHIKYPVDNIGKQLFYEGMGYYLDKHGEKKFHDPSAAVGYLHPNVFEWVRGKLFCEKGEWGTDITNQEDYVAAAVDFDKLWEYIFTGK